MQVIIHGKNIEIIDKIKIAVNKVLDRLQTKYSKYIKAEMVAKVGIERHSDHTYKIAVHIPLLNKNYLQCSVENHDLYAGIKQILLILEQQLCHLKTVANNDTESISDFMTKEYINENDSIIDISEDEY